MILKAEHNVEEQMRHQNQHLQQQKHHIKYLQQNLESKCSQHHHQMKLQDRQHPKTQMYCQQQHL
jgi:predicted RNase H-like nuclease (RuvC/YqgF family)